jgi:hypothetical protein
LAAYIERRYPTDELRMCDTETIHFAYWDVSHRSVSSEFLDHIQAAGYRVLHAGVATRPRRSTQRAWVECRKHDPAQNGTERDTITVFSHTYEEEFTRDDALSITILGPGDVRYTCPKCGHGTDGPPPILNEE